MQRSGLHVLLVEDDTDHRATCMTALEAIGCRVDVAVDGGAAVSRTAALKPDVVIMDLGLPIIDGWQAIRQIRQMTAEHRPHIIVMTGLADERSRRLAFEAGCDDFLRKPCDLQLAIRKYAASRQHGTEAGAMASRTS